MLTYSQRNPINENQLYHDPALGAHLFSAESHTWSSTYRNPAQEALLFSSGIPYVRSNCINSRRSCLKGSFILSEISYEKFKDSWSCMNEAPSLCINTVLGFRKRHSEHWNPRSVHTWRSPLKLNPEILSQTIVVEWKVIQTPLREVLIATKEREHLPTNADTNADNKEKHGNREGWRERQYLLCRIRTGRPIHWETNKKLESQNLTKRWLSLWHFVLS